mmetsp:Transcript_100628/g.289120  ORF Transcript_100628/g.289120 Transcript_100628/m.289120 type:complete len:394 (-) Transcript_100628:8-1189(-)
MELLDIRCLVEVQVTSKDLVRALSRKDHLDAGGLDPPGHEVHGRRSSDRCDIECLKVEDYIRQCVDALPRSELVLVVNGLEVIGDLPCGLQIGAALEADAERMKLWPIRRILAVRLLAAGAMPGHDGSHQRRVQTAAQENAVRHIAHHVGHNSILEGLPEGQKLDGLSRHLVAVPPLRGVEQPALVGLGIVNMARREALVAEANLVECLQLAGEANGTILAPSFVQRDDADCVAGGHKQVLVLVPQNESEHAADLVLAEKVDAVLDVKTKQNLAIALGGKCVLTLRAFLELLTQLEVIIDLAVHAKHDAVILIIKRLVTGVRVDDREPFMGDDRAALAIHAAPVRAAMAQQLRRFHRLLAHGLGLLQPEEGQNPTHGDDCDALGRGRALRFDG